MFESPTPGDLATARFQSFVREGSDKALADALHLVAPELMRSAVALTRRGDEAADLVQETFLAAIESRHRFDGSRGLCPWLVGIMQNLHRYQRRTQSRRVDAGRLAARAADDPATVVHRRMVLAKTLECIETLPAPYREVVALHVRDGLPPEEIGRRLGLQSGQARTRLWRGLARLRAALPPGFVPLVLALLTANGVRGAEDPGEADPSQPPRPDPARAEPAQCFVRRWPVVRAPRLVAACALLAVLTWAVSAATNSVSPPPTPAVVAAAARGHVAAVAANDVAPAEPDSRTILTSTEPRGSVRAHLVWSDGGEAANVSVRLNAGYRTGTSLLLTWFETVHHGWTDAHGFVEFADVPPGPARLLFDDGGVRSEEFQVVGGAVTQREELLACTGEAAGSVVDAVGNPVAGAEVWFSCNLMLPGYVAARTGGDGRFSVRIVSRSWNAWATAPSFARSALVSEPTPVNLSQLRLVLGAAPAVISGKVRTAAGNAVPGALVGAFQGRTDARAAAGITAPSYVRADERGGFCFEGIGSGDHYVVARGAAGCAGYAHLDLDAGRQTHVDLELGTGGAVRGRALSDEALTEAFVRLVPETRGLSGAGPAMLAVTVPLDPSGTFDATGVPAGPTIVSLHQGRKRDTLARQRIEVVEGELVTVELATGAERFAAVAGVVRDGIGGAVAGADVRSMPAVFDWITMRNDFLRTAADAEGGFSFRVREGVAHRCVAVLPSGLAGAVSEPFVARAGQVALVMGPAASRVRGRLVARPTADAPWAIDLYQLPLGNRLRHALGEHGGFDVAGVPAGDYEVCAVFADELVQPIVTSFHVDGRETRELGVLDAPELQDVAIELRRADGMPVRPAGSMMTAAGPGHHVIASVASTADGRLAVRLPAGEFELRLPGSDFLAVRCPLVVRGGEPNVARIDVQPARTCALQFPLPVGGARTRLWLCITGADGERIVDGPLPVPLDSVHRLDLGLPPGRFRLAATDAMGLVANHELIVPDGPPEGAAPLTVVLPLH